MPKFAALPLPSAERLRFSEKRYKVSTGLCLDLSGRRQCLITPKVDGNGRANPHRTLRRQRRAGLLLATFILLFGSGCSQSVRRSGIPAGAQSVLDTSIEDIDAGRYEKLYHEAADEWRNDTTLDESKATFQRLREKLGRVRTRNLQSAREEETSTAPIAGHSVVVLYETSFERGDGMEAFTLLEHGGSWYLGRYYVTSSALK